MVDREIVSKVSNIEVPLLEALGLSRAMIMALAGQDRAAGTEEEQADAIERLALAVERNLAKATQLWNDALHQARGP